MIKSIILISLVLLIPITVIHSLTSIYTNYSKPTVITSLSIYKNLEYQIELKKQVTINETESTLVSNTFTTTVVQKQVLKTYEQYVVNYTITNISQHNVYVKVYGNFSNNFTFIKSGNYSLNILQDVISLNYPYIPPFLLLNNTYALFVKNSPIVMSFIKSLNYSVNGKNITAYRFAIIYNSTYFSIYDILSNGLLANYTTNYNSSTLVMSLIGFSKEYNLTSNSSFSGYLSKPYLYLESIYSSASKSLQPSNYVETYYPFIFANYIGQIVYLLYPQQGSIVEPNSFYGVNVDFELYFKPLGSQVLIYLQSNQSTIKWNGNYFNYVNITPLKLINGSTVDALLYRNTTVNATVYLYFSPTSHILLEELVYDNISLHNYSVKLQFLGNEYYSINQQFPTLTSQKYTTLNYSLVNFKEGLVIAVAVTVVLSAIIILFRRR